MNAKEVLNVIVLGIVSGMVVASLGEKSPPHRKGTGYHPTFVEVCDKVKLDISQVEILVGCFLFK